MHKDHRLAGELASRLKVPMVFNNQALEGYQALRTRGLGGKDVTEIFPVLAQMVGVTLDERHPNRIGSETD